MRQKSLDWVKEMFVNRGENISEDGECYAMREEDIYKYIILNFGSDPRTLKSRNLEVICCPEVATLPPVPPHKLTARGIPRYKLAEGRFK